MLLFCLSALYVGGGGGTTKQDTAMFLKYCDLYQGFVYNLEEVLKKAAGISGCLFLKFPAQNPVLLVGEGSQGFLKLSPSKASLPGI